MLYFIGYLPNIGAAECLELWVYEVSSTGTFTKAKEMESLPNSIHGIPNGWTVVDYEQ